jgi:hypothetical protein
MTAHVQVSGRLITGGPTGSVDLSEVVTLDRDGAGWCMFELSKTLLPR